MQLLITERNLIRTKDWIFQLQDDYGNISYILDDPYYKILNLESPLNKGHLDYFQVGTIIRAETKKFTEKNIVVLIY